MKNPEIKAQNLFTLLVAVVLLSASISMAQRIDRAALGRQIEKSLVRVKITGGKDQQGQPRGTGYASGFVWKNRMQVVTSLHAMRRGNDVNISLEWTSAPSAGKKGPWGAEIESVYKEADLVLLKVVPGRLAPPEWTPITAFAGFKVDDQVLAFGYHSSAPGWRDIKLTIANAQIKNLRNFPTKIAEKLAGFGIPNVDMEVAHFEGNSLFPGYSGGPIVNADGQVVAIGDGGIEEGRNNLSWGIPAVHLDKLVNAGQKGLPENLNLAAFHYSAEEPPNKPIHNDKFAPNEFHSFDDYFEERQAEVKFGAYEFFYTKTRSLGEMMATSDQPEELLELVDNFRDANFDFESFTYDIYQDINFGIIIAIPTGANLRVEQSGSGQDAGEVLRVDFGDPLLNQNYSVVYQYDEDVQPEERALFNSPYALIDTFSVNLAQAFQSGLVLDPEETIVRRMPNGGMANLGYYLTDVYSDTIAYNFNKVAVNDDVWLMAVSLINDFNSQQLRYLEQCLANGLNCEQIDLSSDCGQMCGLLSNWMYILTSVHLTTFVNFDVHTAAVVLDGKALD